MAISLYSEDAASAFPATIKHAMCLLIESMYRNRGEIVICNNASAESKPLAFGVRALLGDYVQDMA